MSDQWSTYCEEMESILGARYGNEQPDDENPHNVCTDRLHYFMNKGFDLLRITRTHGIKEGVYTTYNYARARLFPRKDVGLEPASNKPDASPHDVLKIPHSKNPRLSIVVFSNHKVERTYNCIKTLIYSNISCEFEILICHDDDDIVNQRLHKYIKNHTFVNTSSLDTEYARINAAMNVTRGDLVAIISSDVFVKPGCFESLINTFDRYPDTVATSPMILRTDGSIFSAGIMQWADGICTRYGVDCNPSLSEYGYMREIDCPDPEFTMIRKEAWCEFNTDKKLRSAFMSFADVSIRMRKRNLVVRFQPQSSAYLEDANSSYLEADKNELGYFRTKWHDTLCEESYSSITEWFRQRDRCKTRRSVLVIDDKVPMFDCHAGGRTTFDYLCILRDLGLKITFAGVSDFENHEPYATILQEMGIEVIFGEKYLRTFQSWLDNHADDFDFVFLNRPEISSRYIEWFKNNTRCKIIYYGHDLHYVREQREYDVTHDKSVLERSKHDKAIELDIMSMADKVLTVSSDEKKIIDAELGTDAAITTPICFLKRENRPRFEDLSKSGLLFVGGYNHIPNVDAAIWLTKEIMPLVWKEMPNIHLTLAGSNPGNKVKSLASDRVTVTGYLSDEELDKLYDSSLISVIPLRYGAGVKGKTVEALRHGMAIVSTPIGIEGIDGAENHVRLCEDAESFACKILELYRSPAYVSEVYRTNTEFAYSTYSYDAALELFRNIFCNSDMPLRTSDAPIRVLDLTYYIECPPTSGGCLRILSPLIHMKKESGIMFDIVFSTYNEEYASKCEEYLMNLPVVNYAKGVVTNDYMFSGGACPEGLCKKVWETVSRNYIDYVVDLVKRNRYDIIQVEHTQFAWIVPMLRMASPGSKIVLDAHNIEYRIYETWLPYADVGSVEDVREKYTTLKNWEEKVFPWFYAAFSVSPIEVDILEKNGIPKTYLVPTGGGIDPGKYTPPENKERTMDILYIGSMNWFPNYHGLKWFIRNVLPIIERTHPEAMVNIVGNGTPDSELVSVCKERKNIKFWGFQEDDVEFFQKSKVFIVPLWIGAGARVKVVTAWCSKIPIVSTVFGPEGLDAVDGKNILMSDDPERFAENIVRILDDPAEGKRISDEAFRTLESKYTLDRCVDNLIAAYRNMAKQ